jgi:hypothetical protein
MHWKYDRSLFTFSDREGRSRDPLWLSPRDISTNHAQVSLRRLQCSLRVVKRDKSSVVIERQIPLAPKTVKRGQQT